MDANSWINGWYNDTYKPKQIKELNEQLETLIKYNLLMNEYLATMLPVMKEVRERYEQNMH